MVRNHLWYKNRSNISIVCPPPFFFLLHEKGTSKFDDATAMLCEVIDEIKNATETEGETLDGASIATPEKGRVWRWPNQTHGSRKNTEGPVLRATVKPVKRFIPELNSAVPPSSSSSSLVQTQSTSNPKQTSSTNVDDTSISDIKTKRQSSSTSLPSQTSTNKKKREQWSVEDKNHFFEAVSVHGKDFEAIQKAIAQKHKKRGDESVVKTKDQVRHLYYRTWTTISKLLDHEVSTNNSSKGTQELLAVINYGELRKKLGGYILKKKGIIKLNELITFGSTSVRVKGKTYRIKTPSCKALKRIHDKEDAAKKSNEVETRRIKLPLRVNLEMHPLSMSAWNHVHLLAHNPRIRFNVSLDCQLSCLLVYLRRKWKSLSDKMFCLAQDTSLNPISNLNNSCLPDESSHAIEIHIPPEATVKAKFQVHEVVTTKTHCIVSYVTQKTGKLSSLKKKKKRFEDTDAADPHGTTPLELCNSSEDEGAFVDHYSDLDEQPCHGGFSINHTDSIKIMVDLECEDAVKLGSNLDQVTESCTGQENDKVVDSFYQETEISAERIDDDNVLTGEMADSGESLSSEKCANEVDSLNKDLESNTNESNELVEKIDDDKNEEIETSESLSLDPVRAALTSECFVPLQSTALSEVECVVAERLSSPVADSSEITTECNIREDEKVDDESVPPVEDGDSPSKAPCVSSAIRRSWNLSNVGDVTLAELYLMLGKPGSFKLCYEWGEKEREPVEANQKLSTSLTALIQYATLMLTKLNNSSANSSKSQKETSGAIEQKPENVGVNVGVQCSLVEKNDQSTAQKSTSGTVSAVSKKSGGKGAKRVPNPLTSFNKTNDTFAVPNIPNRRKRNQSQIANSSSVSKVAGAPPGGQVRLVDVAFRKQMDALYRRIDLFRTHSRNRSTRKPFIVQRTMMPNAKSVRKMMTLSIDSLGTNRVGFSPLANHVTYNSDEPKLEAVGATIPSASSSSAPDSDPTARWNPASAGDDSAAINQNHASGAPSVLAQAAEEAGLLSGCGTSDLPSTSESGNSATETTSNDQSINIGLSNDDHASSTTCLDSGKKTSATNDCSTSHDDYQPALIKNDVSLPIRPPSPNVDSISDIFNFSASANDFLASVPLEKVAEGRQTPMLSMPVLDLPLTPQKPFQSPVHPWSINCNSRDGLSGFPTLDTPQRILLSDSEDSIDSSIFNTSKRPRFAGEGEASASSYNDAETELQMECLMSENSVDFMAKFQHLIHNSSGDKSCSDKKSPDDPVESEVLSD